MVMATVTSADEIDILLTHYLSLLDTYTSLRAQLNTIQSSIHQSISRANFSNQHNIRYGQDYYDERMRASRLLSISADSSDSPSSPTFTIVSSSPPESASNESSSPTKEANESTADAGIETKPESKKKLPRDPIYMFGILTPPSLRAAQKSAIEMMELVPKMASVEAEMREVEIQVRRGRKWLLKGEKKSGGLREKPVAKSEGKTGTGIVA